jgi:hypothetical protein
MIATISLHHHMDEDRRYHTDCVNSDGETIITELDDHTIASGFCDGCGKPIEWHEVMAAQERVNEERRRDAE